MIQPAHLAERIVTLHASLLRLLRLAESVPAYSFPDPVERQRALDEAKSAIAQHAAFEQPFRPFG